ncbi:Detected protein of confused Function [Hibiscus syriacus]|uniref:Detected protein of confused Function n=1 Tax=Hibiscus syriacus TaxID=106335 RepID=A0A6A3AHF2_HIBSY|nr:Detected protein of confused Function [Hibiscus syriacus]
MNSLLHVHLLSRKFDEMKEVFSRMEKYARPDTCTYNILINACCLNGHLDDAWNLFDEMQRRGLKPDSVTFGTSNALCMELKINEAFKLKEDMGMIYNVHATTFVYEVMIGGLCRIVIYNNLLSGLFKAGRQDEAFGVFEEMDSNGIQPDTTTYNVMINQFCEVKYFESAYRVLKEMPDKGCKPNVITFNMLIDMLCKDGKWSEANDDLFEGIPRQGCKPDVVSYRTLFDGLCGGLQLEKASFIFDEMIFKGYVPHSVSIHKFVSGLCQGEDIKLLLRVLNSLAKGNAIDEDTWLMVVSRVYQEDNHELSITSQLRDTLLL